MDLHMNFRDVDDFLSETAICFLATQGDDGPRVRGLMYQGALLGRLWFWVDKSDACYHQLQACPTVELCAVKMDMTWLRVRGNVIIEDNAAVKKWILEKDPVAGHVFGSYDNPDFGIFCLEHGKIFQSDESGQASSCSLF